MTFPRRLKTITILVFLVLLVGGAGGWTLMYVTEHVLPYSPIRPSRCTAEVLGRNNQAILSPSAVGLRWETFDILVEDSLVGIGGLQLYPLRFPHQRREWRPQLHVWVL